MKRNLSETVHFEQMPTWHHYPPPGHFAKWWDPPTSSCYTTVCQDLGWMYPKWLLVFIGRFLWSYTYNQVIWIIGGIITNRQPQPIDSGQFKGKTVCKSDIKFPNIHSQGCQIAARGCCIDNNPHFWVLQVSISHDELHEICGCPLNTTYQKFHPSSHICRVDVQNLQFGKETLIWDALQEPSIKRFLCWGVHR